MVRETPKTHTSRYSIHALGYCSECKNPNGIYARKKLVKSFLSENPGLTRDSLRTLIKDKKVLCHRFKNRFYVCWR